MSRHFNQEPSARSVYGDSVSIDQGLRSYMISVYNYMALGLCITGFIAFLVSTSPQIMFAIFGTPLKWVVLLAPFFIVFTLSSRIGSMSFYSAQVTFWVYAALMGISLSSIFLIFTGESISKLFFITASIFGSMSLYGYTTKKDLSEFGSFLIMGVFGIVVASLVNIFLQSSAMQMMISVIGVLVFTGLTAYDTQNIKEMYFESDSSEVSGKKAIIGALSLYINFINLFIALLQLFGNRR